MRLPALIASALVLATAACTDDPVRPADPGALFAKGGGGPPLLALGVAVGAKHACAVGMDRRAYCWGDNTYGQLGDGTQDGSLVPVPVSGGLRFQDIASGGRHHTCARTDDGAVWCWGRNGFGQLGDGTTTNSSVPVRAHAGTSFTSVDVGTYHTCGIATDDVAYCWGSNGPLLQGGFADGWAFGAPTTTLCVNPEAPYRGDQWHCSLEPVAIPGPELVTVAAGLWATCGLTSAGEAWCSGWNTLWALGNGSFDHAAAMTRVAGGPTFDALELGAVGGCGLTAGVARCWGGRFFNNGTTGTGGAEGSAVPTPVAGGLAWASLAPSDANDIYSLSCGVTTSEEAYCTGTNRFGGLGTSADLDDCGGIACALAPVPVDGPRFLRVAAGQEFACGVARNRAVHCWGRNDRGQVGDGTQEDRWTPVRVVGVGARGRKPADKGKPAAVQVIP